MPVGAHGRQGGPPWRKVKQQALARDGYVCRTRWDSGCTEVATTGDHIIPLSMGGIELDLANVIASCAHCNHARGNKPLSARPTPPALKLSRRWY